MILHFFRRILGCLTIFFPCRFQARSPASPCCMECSHAFYYFPPSRHVPGLGRSIAIAVGKNRSYWECTIGALYACSSHFRLCGGCHLRVWRVRKTTCWIQIWAHVPYKSTTSWHIPQSFVNQLSLTQSKGPAIQKAFATASFSESLFILWNRHGENGIPENDKMIDVWMFDSNSQVLLYAEQRTHIHACLFTTYKQACMLAPHK